MNQPLNKRVNELSSQFRDDMRVVLDTGQATASRVKARGEPFNCCAPEWAYPRLNSKTCKMLALLLCDESVAENELCRQFGHNYRSVIQRIEGERYLWRIINVLDERGEIVARKLDDRHKLGDSRLDVQARLQRRVELRTKSAAQAARETRRFRSACIELAEAMEQLEALNTANKKAPTEAEA